MRKLDKEKQNKQKQAKEGNNIDKAKNKKFNGNVNGKNRDQ